MLELRLQILGCMVDQFIITEAPTTFSGRDKALTFDIEKFKPWKDKIKYFVIDENYSQEEIAAARASKYTNGDPRWMHEFMQKESIKKAMTHLKDEDICIVGDVDEIYDTTILYLGKKLKLHVYAYYLNMRSSEEFWGPICYRYKDIKDACLNELRNSSPRTEEYAGWHFTNQGGVDALMKKIGDNYNIGLLNDSLFPSVSERYGKIDYIGRDFKLWVDESEWPTYLKNNREKYARLLSNPT